MFLFIILQYGCKKDKMYSQLAEVLCFLICLFSTMLSFPDITVTLYIIFQSLLACILWCHLFRWDKINVIVSFCWKDIFLCLIIYHICGKNATCYIYIVMTCRLTSNKIVLLILILLYFPLDRRISVFLSKGFCYNLLGHRGTVAVQRH